MNAGLRAAPVGRRGSRGRKRSLRIAAEAGGYWIVRWHAWLAAGAFGYALAHRAFVDPRTWGLSHGVAITSLLGLVALRVAARFGTPVGTPRAADVVATSPGGPGRGGDERQSDAARQEDLNLGLLLVVSFHVLFQFTGGQQSPYYPLTYMFVAFHSAFAERRAGGTILLACLAAEGFAAIAAGLSQETATVAATNGAFILVFSISWWGWLKGQAEMQRLQHRQAVEEQHERTLEEARDFKLIASALTRDSRTRTRTRQEEERIHLREAVASIQRTFRTTLSMLRDAYGLHSCVLYWQDDRGRLQVRDALSGSKVFDDRTLDAKEGFPGAAFNRREPVRQHNLKADDPRLSYYRPGERVFSMFAIPIFQGSYVRGVLVGDRTTSLAFTPANEANLVLVGKLIADAVANERVFLETERAKDAQERFHRALKGLNDAQQVGEVHQAVIEAVTEVADFDFAAITDNDLEERVHRIVCIDGPHRELLGLEVPHGAGMVSQVSKINSYLPVSGKVAPGRTPCVFTPEAGPFDMRSMVVMPLPSPKGVVGTLTLAAKAEDAYPIETRARLEVILSAAAISLVNSQYLQKVQELATTDPLTELFNRRVFHERFNEMAARCRRSLNPLSVLMVDLDHFKIVNDTFGHDAGDEVLRRTADELRACVRGTDIVARLGGEEFAVLLEDASQEAAMMMAERIRASVAGLVVVAEAGEVRPTTSVGCTTWHGDDSDVDQKSLMEQADQALYRAKGDGRNRAVHFHDMQGNR